ncbi:MAG: hypothetical protein J0M04_24980 [Verrucomicrobia bacterium]|nr:hypothetical protein [Verrucomicrobiota bacterium]MBN8457752.1 hypothetical protein [Verrucomicrobiota bacterium]MBN8457766.1 hypothetical protein [Verrucomicrobiota bacterium]MBN8457896.1 hypothetical protein [Verrucomicrobiota bacterium]MBN8458262.1 hypothetical protein [Verrucomicrobiota bacterium]
MNSLHEILDVTHLNFRVRFSILRGDELRLLLIAVCTYLMIAILHKQIKLPGTLHRTLQILSVHPFEKVTLNELLMETEHRTMHNANPNQLMFNNL